LILHELGHSSGLAHDSYWSSIMNPNRFYNYVWPTDYNRRDCERLYPW
jgi:predicted Zn-dependent protease